MINTIIFDLDGTLLPQDQDQFINAYFSLLTNYLSPHGYPPEKLLKAVWSGTKKMIQNDGKMTNEEVFWREFITFFGEESLNDKEHFAAFYRTKFSETRSFCGFNPQVPPLIKQLKEDGYQLILATNPVFPLIATEQRIRWAGLNPRDFFYVTTYENSHFSKPNLKYYEEIIHQWHIDPLTCLMVGNDVDEDMVSGKLGFKTFLLTDCLINKNAVDIKNLPQGDISDLINFIACEKAENLKISY